jgi:hypothetical protein
VAFNTGIVFLRNTPATIRFVEAWKAKVLENNDLTIRDQAAFNIVLREGFDPKRAVPGYENYPRQVPPRSTHLMARSPPAHLMARSPPAHLMARSPPGSSGGTSKREKRSHESET